jgi:hypothetical protein
MTLRALLVAGLAAGIAACASTARSPVTGGPLLASAVPAWEVKAASYLDGRALDDVARPPRVDELPQNLDCTATCHTSQPYLLARASLPGGDEAIDRVRASIEARSSTITDWATATPWFGKHDSKLGARSLGSEAVVEAAALADADVSRGRPLSASSLRALTLMWKAQRWDGAWDWFDFHFEPWETGDDCGAAMAASLVAALPAYERERSAANVDRLATYVRRRLGDAARPPEVHQRVFYLWASDGWPGLLDDARRAALAKELADRQRPDGGWSIATWGSGKLADPAGASDGYATAIATLALCEGGFVPESVARGLAWLGRAQRDDGSWPGQSLNNHEKLNATFEADMATAYAVLALTRCKR